MDPVNPRRPIFLNADDISGVASERFPDPSIGGDVSWKTLVSAPKTPTNTFTVGIATCAPSVSSGSPARLKPHRHEQAEIYHFILGKGIVTIDGVEYAVGKGSVVWIPGDAEHGVQNVGVEDLVWLYAFAADSFENVLYRFNDPEHERGHRRGKEAPNTRAKL